MPLQLSPWTVYVFLLWPQQNRSCSENYQGEESVFDSARIANNELTPCQLIKRLFKTGTNLKSGLYTSQIQSFGVRAKPHTYGLLGYKIKGI